MPEFELPPPSRDPIFAPLTSGGPGALAVFALDGAGAGEAWRKVFQPRKPTRLLLPPPGQPWFGQLLDLKRDGQIVDEAICAYLPPEESETGCEHFELSVHGGAGALASVSSALEAAGFRAAHKGELDCRAHRAARLPLPELEARLRLGGKPAFHGGAAVQLTERQALYLLSNPSRWRERWERLGQTLALGMREGNPEWREVLREAAREDLDHAPGAQGLLRSARVVLGGPPNAGKSTLANRFLRAQKSLVSPEAGTTRDVLERPCELRGLTLLLSDSAGLEVRPSKALDQAAQARALEAARGAKLLVLLLDGSRAPLESECAVLSQAVEAQRSRDINASALLVLNKSDLGIHAEAEGLGFALGVPVRAVSAQQGVGLAELEQAIERTLLGIKAENESAPDACHALPTPFTQRQCGLLERLQQGLASGLEDVEVLALVRALVGSRPQEVELEKVFREWLA